MLEATDLRDLATIADKLEAAIFERSQTINHTTNYVELQEMRLAIEVLRIVREDKLNYPKTDMSVRKPPSRAAA
jgi:hypothetical protein